MGSRKTGLAKFKLGVSPLRQYQIIEPNEYQEEVYGSFDGLTLIAVPTNALQEVVEYFMDELPLGSIVRAKFFKDGETMIFEHLGGVNPGWYRPGDKACYTWADLLKAGDPEVVYEPGVDPHETCG